MSARFALRHATAEAHETLDLAMSRLDLAKPADYAAFLTIHCAVLPALEDWLAKGGLGALVPSWEGHRRTAALARDMAALKLASPEPIAADIGISPAALLGAAYALEGSRLGSQVLAKQVPTDFPDSFLRGQGNIAPWPELIARLDRLLSTPEDFDQAKASALAVFGAYSKAAIRSGLDF